MELRVSRIDSVDLHFFVTIPSGVVESKRHPRGGGIAGAAETIRHSVLCWTAMIPLGPKIRLLIGSTRLDFF